MTTRPFGNPWRRSFWGTLVLLGLLVPATARAETFDFDNAPIRTSLPLFLTVGGVTAHFTATGSGFSIQPANTMGFTPAGFGGLCIYPNGINQADLLVGFSVPIIDFSILYAPQELGCDDSAIMRVTAYMDGALRGTNTTTAPAPGTWPTGTLTYSDPAGFNQVVIHYDRPPACTDRGPIFMADNMNLTLATTSVPRPGPGDPPWMVAPTLVPGEFAAASARVIESDGRDDAGDAVGGGVYLCRVTTEDGVRSAPVIVRR